MLTSTQMNLNLKPRDYLQTQPSKNLLPCLSKVNVKAAKYTALLKEDYGLKFMDRFFFIWGLMNVFLTCLHSHLIYSSSPLFMVSLSVFSVTCGQSWYENIKWKYPEIDNS